MRVESENERVYLQELIADFGDLECPPVDDALEKVRRRFEDLTGNVETTEEAVHQWHWPGGYTALACLLHRLLFAGILANAGVYRQSSDPGGGLVGFGGPARRRAGEFRYHGAAPERIADELEAAFSVLQHEPDPVRASILMYRRFVRVHPFYDANGRVARLLVTFYLVSRGFYPDWKLLDSRKGTFLRKLNDAHDHADRPHTRDGYEQLLVDFWAKHVSVIADFFGDGEDLPPETFS